MRQILVSLLMDLILTKLQGTKSDATVDIQTYYVLGARIQTCQLCHIRDLVTFIRTSFRERSTRLPVVPQRQGDIYKARPAIIAL
ncbi:hypothetical protein BX661DRAFT_181131 [Kickxella alabastrina]|uniref:uncharacterized protein n=1 Tax=Kickxella alabastrina TaxID=61397 RepID=UPI00221FF586|nr:uncharacterized protein BX661DRAFT_181131 [Kickxella alabastrina]KAI7830123.1 hypothetical protein BX661DRAFT_181131 [Kickxella alabastrina]